MPMSGWIRIIPEWRVGLEDQRGQKKAKTIQSERTTERMPCLVFPYTQAQFIVADSMTKQTWSGNTYDPDCLPRPSLDHNVWSQHRKEDHRWEKCTDESFEVSPEANNCVIALSKASLRRHFTGT